MFYFANSVHSQKELNLIQENRDLFYFEHWLKFNLKYQGFYSCSLNNDKEMLTFVIAVLIMFQIHGWLSLRCLPSLFSIIFRNWKLTKIKTNLVFFFFPPSYTFGCSYSRMVLSQMWWSPYWINPCWRAPFTFCCPCRSHFISFLQQFEGHQCKVMILETKSFKNKFW